MSATSAPQPPRLWKYLVVTAILLVILIPAWTLVVMLVIEPEPLMREQDTKKYPWSANEKEGQEGLRSGDSLENGAKFTPMYWGIPTFAAVSAADDPKDPVSAINPTTGLAASADSVGLGWHLFVAAA